MLYIGLMSGTSADGIDGALLEITDSDFRILATHSGAFSPGIQAAIESVVRDYPDVDRNELNRLDAALGADFARVAEALRRQAGPGAVIQAIGSHGQTVYHGPGDEPPVSIQIADPQTIADRTGLTTVGQFRLNDMRAGGQGAPLAPAFHDAMFRDAGAERLVANIGGIANITVLPAEPGAPVLGFDTGPGNTLMDGWCRASTGRAFDDAGEWAATGQADEAFVEALLADPYFALPAPKSTGREYFHLDWMKARWPAWREADPADIQAGLLEVSVRSICEAAARASAGGPCEMFVCGGGAYNAALMQRLVGRAPGRVATTAALGLPPEWVEACAFAWLAHRRLRELPGNLPSVTGAAREVMLGDVFTPGARQDDGEGHS